jgi:hypothetical protein
MPGLASTTLTATNPAKSNSVRATRVTPMMSTAGARQAATTAIERSANSPRLRSMNTDIAARPAARVSRARSTAFTASPPTIVGRKMLKNIPMK